MIAVIMTQLIVIRYNRLFDNNGNSDNDIMIENDKEVDENRVGLLHFNLHFSRN